MILLPPGPRNSVEGDNESRLGRQIAAGLPLRGEPLTEEY